MQIHARYTCIAPYKAADQKKNLRKTEDRHKNTADRAAAVGD